MSKYGDSINLYTEMGIIKNGYADAIPQTKVYDLVAEHFDASLPEGKTVKKAIVIGYDGARCDTILQNAASGEESAVKYLSDTGCAYVAYAGGEKDTPTQQSTDTAAGWSAINTGKWGIETKVTGNGIIKEVQYPSFMTDLADKYKIKSSFNVVWGGHYKRVENGTYCNEVAWAKEQGINFSMNTFDDEDDQPMQRALIKNLTDRDCDDVTMSIYERPDHEGHSSGFGGSNPGYVKCVADCDKDALELIRTIENRPTYSREDWLIIAAADHGGTGQGHGGQTPQERTVFIACNKNF